jgi:hypothetical protein
MADVIKSIKASGGDYTTIAAWLASIPADLVSANQRHIGELYNETYTITATIDISGHTVDATRYIWLRANSAAKHIGKAKVAGVYTGACIKTTSVEMIWPDDDYTRVSGLIFDQASTSDLNIFSVASGGYGRRVFDNILIRTAGSNTGKAVDWWASNVTNDNQFYNNIVYGEGSYKFATGLNIYRLYINNNTVYNCTTGIALGGTNASYHNNNIVMGCTTCFSGTYAGSDYNMSSDATAPGAHSLINKTSSNQFVSLTSGAEDLQLKAGADAINAGTDLSALGFSTDIIGTSRPQGAAWDIGASEYVAAAGNWPLLQMKNQMAYNTMYSNA